MNGRGAKNNDKIDRPLNEIEMPHFFVAAEEIVEAERQAELERLAKLPIYYLSPAQLRKKEQKEKRRRFAEESLPQWFLEPLD